MNAAIGDNANGGYFNFIDITLMINPIPIYSNGILVVLLIYYINPSYIRVYNIIS